MSVPIPLRRDFNAARLRGLENETKDGPQARRLLTLAAICDVTTRSEAAKIGGVGLQIIRDWVLRFNAQGPDGLLDRKPPGQPSKLNDDHRQAIARMIKKTSLSAGGSLMTKRSRHDDVCRNRRRFQADGGVRGMDLTHSNREVVKNLEFWNCTMKNAMVNL